ETGPLIVEPQTRIDAAAEALRAPLIVAPCTTRPPPVCTVSGPSIVVPCGIRTDWPGPTVSAPLFMTPTGNDLGALFPARSVAWQVTVVVPSGNSVPDAGAQPALAARPDSASAIVTRPA